MLLLWPRHSVPAGALQPGMMVVQRGASCNSQDEIVPVLEPVVTLLSLLNSALFGECRKANSYRFYITLLFVDSCSYCCQNIPPYS